MKFLFLALSVAVLATACTDAHRASLMTYGNEAAITCYSGGQIIFEDVSTGKVAQLDGDGITYKSKRSDTYIRAFADCIVKG